MLKEFAEWLLNQRKPMLAPWDAEKYFWPAPDGTWSAGETRPPLRAYTAHTLESFIQQTKHFDSVDSVVFCGRGQVVAVLEEDTRRRERITLKLTTTQEFDTLRRLASSRGFIDHEAFCRMLRVDLADCIDKPLVAALCNLTFARTDDGESRVDPGARARKRAATSKVLLGGQPIPDTLAVSLNVYRDAEETERRTVFCSLECDPDEGEFLLLPRADELERVQRETDEWIRDRLLAELSGVAVFLGAP